MRCIKFSRTLKYKWISQSWPEDQTNFNEEEEEKEEKNLSLSGFCHFSGPQSKSRRKRKYGQYLDLAREKKKLWNIKVTVIRIVVGALRTVLKFSGKKTVETEDQRKNQGHIGHRNFKIS